MLCHIGGAGVGGGLGHRADLRREGRWVEGLGLGLHEGLGGDGTGVGLGGGPEEVLGEGDGGRGLSKLFHVLGRGRGRRAPEHGHGAAPDAFQLSLERGNLGLAVG
jgi:hypothetical protein